MTCEIAPKECVYGDGSKTLFCCVCRIMAAFRKLHQSFPFFGDWFPDYQCPYFEPLDK